MAPSDYKLVRQMSSCSSMEPSDYNSLRTLNISLVSDKNETESPPMVDGYPYLPDRMVVANDIRSIQKVVWYIMIQLPGQHNDDDCASARYANLQVEPVSGGITNTLYKVSGLFSACIRSQSRTNRHTHCYDAVDCVLVRVFGADGMIDRDVENSTYAALADQRLAPAYYGRFGNGRLEQFIPLPYRALQTEELSSSSNLQISTNIAMAMAELHVGFHTPESLQDIHDVTKPSFLWTQIYDWYEQSIQFVAPTETAAIKGQLKEEAYQLLHTPSSIYQEIQWIQKEILAPHQLPLVFCHNDLLAGNILYNSHTQQVQMIDFEYGGMNYAYFDMANHFNEYAGGPPTHPHPDYTLFPTYEQQHLFCSLYLEKAKEIYKNQTTITTNNNNPYLEQIVNIASIDEMIRYVSYFVLVNHLYWGLWAINQSFTEGNETFHYMKYAQNRFRQYWICQEKIRMNEENKSTTPDK